MSNRESAGCALITGAGSASGIGFATAQKLARGGQKIVITSTTERIHERAEELRANGAEVLALVADLTDESSAREVVMRAMEFGGRPTVCVNNAGMVQTGGKLVDALLEDYEAKTWNDALRRNLTSCFHVTRAVLPLMKAARYGRIVNVSSTSGPVQAFPGDVGYHAAKAGMVGFTRAVALEAASDGVTVNAVAPGWIATGSQTAEEAAAGEATPTGRSGTAEEVAAVIAFLASREASYITGQPIVVDGGNSLPERRGGGSTRSG